jgi:hypothetical protein
MNRDNAAVERGRELLRAWWKTATKLKESA